MKFEVINYIKDHHCFCGIAMFEKDYVKGKCLLGGEDVNKKTKDAMPGDVFVQEETDLPYACKFVEFKVYNNPERLKNLKKAYFHLLDCADAGSYSLTNPHVEELQGLLFPDLKIFSTCQMIIEGTIELLKKEKILPEKLKEITKIHAQMEDAHLQIFDLPIEGNRRVDIDDAVVRLKKTYNEKNETKLKARIHKTNMEYLTNTGRKVFEEELKFTK